MLQTAKAWGAATENNYEKCFNWIRVGELYLQKRLLNYATRQGIETGLILRNQQTEIAKRGKRDEQSNRIINITNYGYETR